MKRSTSAGGKRWTKRFWSRSLWSAASHIHQVVKPMCEFGFMWVEENEDYEEMDQIEEAEEEEVIDLDDTEDVVEIHPDE